MKLSLNHSSLNASSIFEEIENQLSFQVVGASQVTAVMNQWTVPLEWNTGMEYWNSLNYYKCAFQEADNYSVTPLTCLQAN